MYVFRCAIMSEGICEILPSPTGLQELNEIKVIVKCFTGIKAHPTNIQLLGGMTDFDKLN